MGVRDLKYIVSVAILPLILTLAPAEASQKIASGGKCKQINKSVSIGNKTYTCKKMQGKLVWVKGKNSNQEVQKTAITLPTGFDDLVSNAKGIQIAAWNSVNKKLKASGATNLELNIIKGPNTSLPNQYINEMFMRGANLFAGYTQPTKINALYYGFEDVKWAQDKIIELYGIHSEKDVVPKNCDSVSRCGGANASLIQPYLGHTNFGVAANNSGAYHTKGGIEIHEYAHTVQLIQFQKTPRQLYLVPVWFVEGHAHLMGNAGSANSLIEYSEFRKQWKPERPAGLSDYSPTSIEQLYDRLSVGKTDNSVFENVYTIGYFTLEALVAIKGVDSPIEVVTQVSSGKSFEEAFLSVYGISWSDGSKILAKAVSRIFDELN